MAATPRKRTTRPSRTRSDSYDLEQVAGLPAPEGAPLADPRPASRLMRVPVDTYELIQRWADHERRHMNQQLAVMVEEWDRVERAERGAVYEADGDCVCPECRRKFRSGEALIEHLLERHGRKTA